MGDVEAGVIGGIGALESAKEKFREHEQYMQSLTQSQENIGRVLHRFASGIHPMLYKNSFTVPPFQWPSTKPAGGGRAVYGHHLAAPGGQRPLGKDS